MPPIAAVIERRPFRSRLGNPLLDVGEAPGSKRVTVPATDCPRISPAFLAEQRESMGAFWFRQEYLCEFVDASSSAFRSVDIERAQAEVVEQWAV